MTARQLSLRWVVPVCLLALVVSRFETAGGPPARAQEPERSVTKAAGDDQTFEEVRHLVKDLETQAESQRTQLKKTEESLKLARALLSSLVKSDDPRLSDLRKQEERASRRLTEIRQVVKRPSADPTAVAAKLRLEQIRAEIRKIESR
jgi:septal ring factor EnvC (AmiA/AmiB activator)